MLNVMHLSEIIGNTYKVYNIKFIFSHLVMIVMVRVQGEGRHCVNECPQKYIET